MQNIKHFKTFAPLEFAHCDRINMLFNISMFRNLGFSFEIQKTNPSNILS